MAKISLELSVYTFTLKEKNSRDGSLLDFNDFFRRNFAKVEEKTKTHEVSRKELYKRFVTVMLDEFQQAFWLNKQEDKGISDSDIDYQPHLDVIDGLINGGKTGHGYKIYDIINNKESKGSVTKEQLASLPYYFKLWTPPDSNVGVLMIQSYGVGSINSVLIEFLKTIFSKYGVTFRRIIHTPEEIREEYANRSRVRKVTYTKTIEDRNSRSMLNRAYEDSDGLRVTITVEKIKNSTMGKFIQKFNKQKPFGVEIEELGFESPEDYETKFYYEDKDGRKAHARLTEEYKFKPTIVLPTTIVTKENNIDLNEIRKFTNGLLDKVKKEIEYSPK
jgi:hypothetical protein